MEENIRPAKIRWSDYELGEELANAITHGVGALLSVWGMVALILRGARMHSPIAVVSAALYGATLFLLYLVSCLYHALTAPGAKRVFRVLDHCTIFLLILGSYIPVTLVLIGSWKGWALFGVNAALAALGVTLTAVDMRRWKKLGMALYIAMGWLVMVALGTVVRSLSPAGVALLIGGGLCYTAGIAFYRRKGRKWMHALWHLCVMAGSFLHFFMIYGSFC